MSLLKSHHKKILQLLAAAFFCAVLFATVHSRSTDPPMVYLWKENRTGHQAEPLRTGKPAIIALRTETPSWPPKTVSVEASVEFDPVQQHIKEFLTRERREIAVADIGFLEWFHALAGMALATATGWFLSGAANSIF